MEDEQVVVVTGLDHHQASNTIAVLEPDETIVCQRRFVNSVEGFDEMMASVADHPDRVWAVEGASGGGWRVMAAND